MCTSKYKKCYILALVGFHRDPVSVEFLLLQDVDTWWPLSSSTLSYRKRQWVHYFLQRLSCGVQMSTSCAALSCLISHAKFNIPSCLRCANWVMYELIYKLRSGRLFCFAATDIMTETKTDALLFLPHVWKGTQARQPRGGLRGTHWAGSGINEILVPLMTSQRASFLELAYSYSDVFFIFGHPFCK